VQTFFSKVYFFVVPLLIANIKMVISNFLYLTTPDPRAFFCMLQPRVEPLSKLKLLIFSACDRSRFRYLGITRSTFFDHLCTVFENDKMASVFQKFLDDFARQSLQKFVLIHRAEIANFRFSKSAQNDPNDHISKIPTLSHASRKKIFF